MLDQENKFLVLRLVLPHLLLLHLYFYCHHLGLYYQNTDRLQILVSILKITVIITMKNKCFCVFVKSNSLPVTLPGMCL